MNITELRTEPHLSASGINDYIDCSLLYKLSRIDKCIPEFTADSLAFGSIIHEVIAIYQNERKMGNSFTRDNMLNCFDYYWAAKAKGKDYIRYKGKSTYDSLLIQGKGLLSVYYDYIIQNTFKVVAVEEPFRFIIEGIDVPIIGVIDLIEEDESGTIVVSDTKTSKQSFNDDKIDKNFQLTLYYMALKANGYKNREILLKLDTLIKTKQPRFEPYYTTRTDDDVRRAARKIMSVWEEIQNNIFIPNDTSWKCGGCAYQTYCREAV